jgi:hypothetical protein
MKALDEMKKVEGEFENLYFHDSPVKDILINSDTITLTLAFAHVLGQHSQNKTGKIICAKDCQLIFASVKESDLKVYRDAEKAWTVIESPGKDALLGEIIEAEVTGGGYYTLAGMTRASQWSEWVIKAGAVTMLWEVEGESGLIKA